MKITITPDAVAALKKRFETRSFILALNDGTNRFSDVGGSCAVADKFQIIPVEMTDTPFTEVLENPEFTVYTSKEELPYLGEDVTLDIDQRLNAFQLKNRSGRLDANVPIKP